MEQFFRLFIHPLSNDAILAVYPFLLSSVKRFRYEITDLPEPTTTTAASEATTTEAPTTTETESENNVKKQSVIGTVKHTSEEAKSTKGIYQTLSYFKP